MKKKLQILLIATAFLCTLFALYNFYKDVLNPDFSHNVRCEGIILDPKISYHITDKNSIQELQKIRNNEVSKSDNDILLHYRDRDMEKITPSYWGSLYYDNQWHFKLDQSFSGNATELPNIHLPFLSVFSTPWYKEIPVLGKFFYNEQQFVKPNETIGHKELYKNHYFNSVSGDRNSRYYLQIKNIKNKPILPWYDDGIKQSYVINSTKSDSIGLFFNSNENSCYTDRNFVFDNTSKKQGNYLLIHNPNKKGSFTLLNTENKKSFSINSSKFFEVEDMMFSINPKYSVFQRFLLSAYLLILIGSIIFFFLKKRDANFTLFLPLRNIRIAVLSLYLLGFPILAMTFAIHNFGWIREMVLAVFVPSIPLLSYLLPKRLVQAKKNSILKNILTKATLLFEKIFKYELGIILVFVIMIASLFLAQNERVLGIPVLHYVKIILLLTFYYIYSNYFAERVKSYTSLIKRPYLVVFLKSIILLFITLIVSFITKDFGVTALVFFSLLIFEHISGNLPKFKVLGKNFTLPTFIILYVGITLILLFISSLLDDPRKLYRLTFSWKNPGNEFFYGNIDQGHRESISILFHNLKIILEQPFGISNLNVPLASKSVAHTDFALHWSYIKNGYVFLSLLLLAFLNFILNALIYLNCIYREDANKNSLVAVPNRTKAFTTFLLILTIIQGVAPIFSNLLLPASFLTGIPAPGISISIGDSLFFLILFLLMENIKSNETNLLNEQTKEDLIKFSTKEASKFSIGLLSLILVFIALKFVLIKFQDEKTEIPTKQVQTEIDAIPLHLSKTELINTTQNYFKDKNITRLTAKDKFGLKKVLVQYYHNGRKKLNNQKVDFELTKKQEHNRISLDSLNTFSKKQISGSKWKGTPVYSKNILVNGKPEKYISNEFYKNLNLNNSFLDKDVSANLNLIAKKHITEDLKNYNNLSVSILITENKTGNIVVNSSYPFDSDNSHIELSFYPGSVKKILLACFFSKQYKKKVNDEIFKTQIASTPIKWIGKSDNDTTTEVFKNYIDLDKFKIFLEEQYNLPFISTISKNGYAETDWKSSQKSINNTLIGGRTKYSAKEINDWFRLINNDAFSKNKELYQMLNSPLHIKGGTATMVATALRENGFDYKNYVCKTGTLEENNRNLSTTFGISNKNYTITVLIDGVQPSNNQNFAAKHLFIKIIPEIDEYLKDNF